MGVAVTGSGRLHAFATRAYDLLDGEHLVMSIGAAHYAAWWLTAAGGMLYLTNSRLIFAPSLLTLWRPALAWGLSEIEGLGRHARDFDGFDVARRPSGGSCGGDVDLLRRSSG